jgi:hypothetical protein
MQRNLYSVYDLKAKTFCNPFVMENDDCAVREFATAALDTTSQICRNPFDYCLYKIASFNYDSGVITPCQPESLGIAASFVRNTSEE